MRCFRPECPAGQEKSDWNTVVSSPEARVQSKDRSRILEAIEQIGRLGSGLRYITGDVLSSAPFKRILELCPCLYAQVDARVTARGVVHLCEVTLGRSIDSSNVNDAFRVQHPGISDLPFQYAPIQEGAGGGDVMEALCSEVLSNSGVPVMENDDDGWPSWRTQSHVPLNRGKMTAIKLYGDILIPAAPHNLLVSVKSEVARERLVLSGNRLESVGFGFFNDPSEFWTDSRMNLLKRWGFVAIYMPKSTLSLIREKLNDRGAGDLAININGRALYRALEEFGPDMFRIAGRLTHQL